VGELLDPAEPDAQAMWTRIAAARRGETARGSGSKLPVPVRNALREDDAFTQDRARFWREIRARRHASPAAPRRLLPWSLGIAAAAALALIAIWPRLQEPTPAPAALTLASGEALSIEEAQAESKTLVFADASRITLKPGTRVTPLAASGTRFEVLLDRGVAEFSVTPGGPRQWSVEAGLLRVEVVGTVFRVQRTEQGVDVQVSHGVVLVRGDAVPGRVRRLTAGQSLHVEPPARAVVPLPAVHPAEAPAVPEAPEARPVPTTARREPRSQPAPIEHNENWEAAFAEGRFDDAYRALGRRGLKASSRRAPNPEELLRLADVARLSNHPQDAVYPLSRVLSAFGNSPHAAVAAFTLGRVLLDQLGSASEAAHAFERAIRLDPPHALLEDCHARLVQAWARADDAQRAAEAASRYRALFPSGRHLPDLDRWTSP
jgi:transmembrane sensor